MAISLHDATVAPFVQVLGGLEGVLAKALEHCRVADVDPETLVETRLHADMLPLRYQVLAACDHSLGAIEAVRSGEFRPPNKIPPLDYAGLQEKTAETVAALKALTVTEMEELQTKDVAFVLSPERRMQFTGEGFLLSFSVPNFYFHVTTAYDILRMKGAPLGKRDYLGRPRIKT